MPYVPRDDDGTPYNLEDDEEEVKGIPSER
jgi:hypothetical protein